MKYIQFENDKGLKTYHRIAFVTRKTRRGKPTRIAQTLCGIRMGKGDQIVCAPTQPDNHICEACKAKLKARR